MPGGRVPGSIRSAMRRSGSGRAEGTEGWLARQPAQRRRGFLATIRAYERGRRSGTVSLGQAPLARLMREEFGYPFGREGLRAYLERRRSR